MEELKNIHYDAFISYRHSELDSFVAEKLHKKLESFRLPKSVRFKVTDGRTKISRVFRDVDELPLSDNLSEPIMNALSNSDYLITICTPRYLESVWCMREIEVFLQSHDRKHVLVVLAEDEPKNSFPEILTYEDVVRTDENGNEICERREIEPLAADTRGVDRREILKAMDIAVVKLCAAIFGLNFDDLKQRHREQRLRRLVSVFGSIAAAVLVFSVFATVMLVKISRQNTLISTQFAELQNRYANSMAAASEELLRQGRRKDAIYAVRSVLPEEPSEGYNPAALKSLYHIMDIYSDSGIYIPENVYAMESEVRGFAVSNDEQYILLYDDISVCVYEVVSGELIKRIDRKEGILYGFMAAFCGSDGIVVYDDDEVYYSPLQSDERTLVIETDESLNIYSSTDSDLVLVFGNNTIQGIGEGGKVLFETNIEPYTHNIFYNITSVSFYNGRFMGCFCQLDGSFLLVGDESDGSIVSSACSEDIYEIYGVMDDSGYYYATSYYGLVDEEEADSDVDVELTNEEADLDDFFGTKLYAVDYDSEVLWEKDIPDVAIFDIYVTKDSVYMYNVRDLVVCDKISQEIKTTFLNDSIVCCWEDYYGFNHVNTDCSVGYYNGKQDVNYTDEFFETPLNGTLLNACYKGGDLFCYLNKSGYVIRYTPYYQSDVNYGLEMNDDYEEFLFAEYDLETAAEVDTRLLDSAIYSNDHKLIFALFTGRYARIYDADTFQVLNSFEVDEMYEFTSLKYYDALGYYVLSDNDRSFILDQNYDIICECPVIVDEREDRLIFQTNALEYYSMPYVSYEELLRQTDEYLGEYQPSESVKRVYGIQ